MSSRHWTWYLPEVGTLAKYAEIDASYTALIAEHTEAIKKLTRARQISDDAARIEAAAFYYTAFEIATAQAAARAAAAQTDTGE